MPAPFKNKFWTIRSKHGRDKIFSSPDMLLEQAYEYFESVIKNPLRELKVFGSGYKTRVPLMRPFTQRGLFLFLNIDRKTWDLYSNREDFIPITERIEDIIYNQKLEGAVVGLFKENIISRELGLADKSQIDFSKLSDQELDRILDKILK